MRFTETEIQLAARLRGAGLGWEPQAGHYVFDVNGTIKAGSPFQAGVHLVTSPNAITAAMGGADGALDGLVWLPAWESCRAWLADRGTTSERLARTLWEGLDAGMTDRESLYRLMLELLESGADEATS